ncbi:hypothetical protein ACFPRL_31925 [Pseudoclavibacter helvolus]
MSSSSCSASSRSASFVSPTRRLARFAGSPVSRATCSRRFSASRAVTFSLLPSESLAFASASLARLRSVAASELSLRIFSWTLDRSVASAPSCLSPLASSLSVPSACSWLASCSSMSASSLPVLSFWFSLPVSMMCCPPGAVQGAARAPLDLTVGEEVEVLVAHDWGVLEDTVRAHQRQDVLLRARQSQRIHLSGGPLVLVDRVQLGLVRDPSPVDDLGGASAVPVVAQALASATSRTHHVPSGRGLRPVDRAPGGEHRAERARVAVGDSTPADRALIGAGGLIDCAASPGHRGAADDAAVLRDGSRVRLRPGDALIDECLHPVRPVDEEHRADFLGVEVGAGRNHRPSDLGALVLLEVRRGQRHRGIVLTLGDDEIRSHPHRDGCVDIVDVEARPERPSRDFCSGPDSNLREAVRIGECPPVSRSCHWTAR